MTDEETLREDVDALGALDCGDSACRFAKSMTGMRTNHGCRCIETRAPFAAGRIWRMLRLIPRVLEELAEARRERDEALAAHKRILNEAVEHSHDRAVEVERLTRERDEAEQRGRAAERRRVRAAVEQMMADAMHEAANAQDKLRESLSRAAWSEVVARDRGKLDAYETVLEMLDAHVGAGKVETQC